MRRFSTILAVTCLAVFGLASPSTADTPPPDYEPTVEADSISNCSDWQPKTFDLPGKPDLWFSVKVCVQKSGNYRRGYIRWQWNQTYWYPSNQKNFDAFILETRLEFLDNIREQKDCDLTSEVGFYGDDSGTCVTSWNYNTVPGGWTGDGTVPYNIDNDGKGWFYWQLGGSPQIR